MNDSQALKILITGVLNSDETKLAINSQLKRISNELKRLNIKVDIDKTVFDTLSKLNTNIEKATKSLHTQQNAIQGVTNATNKETQAINNQNRALERRSTLLDAQGNVKRTTETYGSEGNFDKKIIDTQYLNGGVQQNIRYVEELKRNLKEIENIERAHYNALKTEQERRLARDKQHHLAIQQNQKREEDFLHRKAAMETKIADIRRRFGSDKNVSNALDTLNRQFSNVTSVGNYSNALKNVDLELKKITASANTARSNAISLGEAFKTAMVDFCHLVW